jgi:hypothetical protein
MTGAGANLNRRTWTADRPLGTGPLCGLLLILMLSGPTAWLPSVPEVRSFSILSDEPEGTDADDITMAGQPVGVPCSSVRGSRTAGTASRALLDHPDAGHTSSIRRSLSTLPAAPLAKRDGRGTPMRC